MKFYITFQMDTHIYTATVQYDLDWDMRLDNWIQDNINRIQHLLIVTSSKYLSDNEIKKIHYYDIELTECDLDNDESIEKYIKNRINHYKTNQ